MLHWWKFMTSTEISSNIFSFIICSTTSIVGCSLNESNVWVNIVAKSSSHIHWYIPIPWYHLQCMYESMNPFLAQILLPCHATMLNMFNKICRSCILVTSIIYLFSKYNLQHSSTLWPLGDRLFMCTPPSSMRSFQQKFQGRKTLRFRKFFFKFHQKVCKVR